MARRRLFLCRPDARYAIAALTAEQPQSDVQRDAERYRWLIASIGDLRHGMPCIDTAWDDDIDDWRSAKFFGLKDKQSIDAAIDAEIAKERT